MLSLGLNLVAAYSGGPSADMLILDAIQRLSEQIEDFRSQMHERLDVVDEKLNLLLFRMSTNFARLRRDVASSHFVSRTTLNELRQLSEDIQFSSANQGKLFREEFFADNAERIANCYYYSGDVPAARLDLAAFDKCLDYFKSVTLAIPGLKKFDDSGHIKFDPNSTTWAFSAQIAPIERIEAELNALFSGGQVTPEYESFNETAFFSILANYFATIRAWPEHRWAVQPTAFDAFVETIQRLDSLDQRVALGTSRWSIPKMAEEYLRLMKVVDEQLYQLAWDVSRSEMLGYREHQYQMFCRQTRRSKTM